MEMGLYWGGDRDSVTDTITGVTVMCAKPLHIIFIIHGVVYGSWALIEILIHVISRLKKDEQTYNILLGLFYMFIKMLMICGFFIFSCYLGDPRVEKIGYIFFIPIIYGMLHKVSVQIKKNTVKVEFDSTYEEFVKDIITKFISKDPK